MRTKLSVRAENFQPQLARRIIRPLLAATLALAITLTFSCSGDDGNSSNNNGGEYGACNLTFNWLGVACVYAFTPSQCNNSTFSDVNDVDKIEWVSECPPSPDIKCLKDAAEVNWYFSSNNHFTCQQVGMRDKDSQSPSEDYDWGDGAAYMLTITNHIKDITDNSFTRMSSYACNEENGELETDETYFKYSISDGILRTLGSYNDISYELFELYLQYYPNLVTPLNGTSSGLIGTWTISDDCASQECLNLSEMGYQYIKAEFTNATLEQTVSFCWADGYKQESLKLRSDREESGIAVKKIDCSTVEFSKGDKKYTVTSRLRNNGEAIVVNQKVIYNGKTCIRGETPMNDNGFSISEKEKACKEAYNTGGNYELILLGDYLTMEVNFKQCLRKSGLNEDFSDCIKGSCGVLSF